MVVAFSVLLIAFTGVVFAKPMIAERILAQFAGSARSHYLEQAFRILVGAALIVLSPGMWHSAVFRLAGWAILITSVALMCAPWQWHHRFGERIRPMFMRYLKVYALAAFAFGVLLLYGVFVGGRAA